MSASNAQTEVADGGSPPDHAPDRQPPFATLFAHNDLAILLLSLVKVSAFREGLTSSNNGIGYRLKLPPQTHPEDGWPGLKWVAGAGMFPKKDHIEVDLLLCPPQIGPARTAIQKSIGAHHAVIHLHPRSGALCLRNQCAKPIVYENGDLMGCDLVLARRHPQDPAIQGPVHNNCVLFRPSNLLQIGEYAFALNFDLRRADRDAFRKERDLIFMREFGIRPSQHLDLVPLKHHSVIHDICIHRMLFQSPDLRKSIFSGVLLHTGEPVAVKAIRYRDKKTQARARSELYTANILRGQNGSNGILGLIDSWCLHGSPPCVGMRISNAAPFENKTPDDGTAVSETSDETTANKTSNETSHNGTTADGAAANEISDDEISDDEISDDEISEDGTTAHGASENDIARAEADEDEAPKDQHGQTTVVEDNWTLLRRVFEDGRVNHSLDGDDNDEDKENEGGLPNMHCNVVCYSTPLAEYSFSDTRWSVIDDRDRVRYFRQTLIGLHTLHSHGIIHGNISPKALMLQLDDATENTKAIGPNTQPSLRAVIGDLGNSWLTSGPHFGPRGAGSRSRGPWIAPEVWEQSTRDAYVGMAADIWGLAISWLHTFIPSVRGKISRGSYDVLIRDMESHVAEPLRGLIRQMIGWLPGERLGVEEALAHQAWAMFSDEERRTRNEGTAAVKRASAGSTLDVKRARFLSPEAETHTYDPETSLVTGHLNNNGGSSREH